MTPLKKKLLIGLCDRLCTVLANNDHSSVDVILICKKIIEVCNDYTGNDPIKQSGQVCSDILSSYKKLGLMANYKEKEPTKTQLHIYTEGDTVYVNG